MQALTKGFSQLKTSFVKGSEEKKTKTFYERFNQLDRNERLLAEFKAHALSADSPVGLTLYITNRSLCIYRKKEPQDTKVVVPCARIVKVERCIHKSEKIVPEPVEGPKARHFFNPITVEEEEYNAIRLYTADQIMHNFFEIADIERFCTLLSYAVDVAHHFTSASANRQRSEQFARFPN